MDTYRVRAGVNALACQGCVEEIKDAPDRTSKNPPSPATLFVNVDLRGMAVLRHIEGHVTSAVCEGKTPYGGPHHRRTIKLQV